MDGKESNKKAREFCKEFLQKRIDEAQKAYDRLTACDCDHLGGRECECAVQSKDAVGTDTPIENGETEINGDAKLPFSSTEKGENISLVKIVLKGTVRSVFTLTN